MLLSYLLFINSQDEYEELLRYAVVAPKLETLTSAYMQRQLSTSYVSADGRTAQRKDDTKSLRPAGIGFFLTARQHYRHTVH